MDAVKAENRCRVAADAMEIDAKTISSCSKLCTPLVAGLAAKYNLRGTISDAIDQLTELIKRFREHPKSIQRQAELDAMDERAQAYRKSCENDPYTIAINEAIEEEDRRKYDVMYTRKMNRLHEMHRKKECICYQSESSRSGI